MATELGKAYVHIVPETKGISKELKNALGNGAGEAGEHAGGLVGGALVGKIKALVAAAGIGAAVGKAISEGAALEQSIGGIETLFKDSADTMKEYAANAYKTAGISANDYMEQSTSFAAALLGSLGGDTAKAAEAANTAIIDMADNSNKMGTSLESIQNAYQGFAKGNYTMLDNLKLGYGGTKTEMERLLADAEKFSGIKYDINNLSDVYDAIHVIQGELDITGTTAKEASTTISGSFASVKGAFQNFLGYLAIGEDVTPALNGLVDSISTFLFDNLIPMVGNIIKALPGAISTFLSAAIPELLENGKALLDSIIDGIESNGDSLFQTGLNLITGLLDKIASMLPDLIQSGIKLVSKLAEGLKNNLPLIAQKAGEIIGKVLAVIVQNLPDIIKAGVTLITSLIKGLVQAIPTLVTTLKQEFKKIDWPAVGKGIIDGIITGLKNGVTAIKEAAKSVAKNALDSAKNFLGIHSPSRVFADSVGKMVDEGFAVGITANTSSVTDSMKKLSDTTLGVATDTMGYISAPKGEYAGSNTLAEDIVNGLSGFGGGNVTVQLNVDGKPLAEILYDKLNNIAIQKGAIYG